MEKQGALRMNGKWVLYLDLVNANPDLKRQARGRLFAAFKNYFTGGFTGSSLKRTNPPGYNKNQRTHLNHRLAPERGGTPAPVTPHFPPTVPLPVGSSWSYLKKNIVPGSPSFAEFCTPITKILAASVV